MGTVVPVELVLIGRDHLLSVLEARCLSHRVVADADKLRLVPRRDHGP